MAAAPAVAVVPVVLADDTDDLRALLRLALEADGGFEVVGEARDGVEAIDVASALRPAVIVLDLAMPVMDGLQAIPVIRERAPETKIVVLSAFDTHAIAREALDAGAHAYLQKGASPAALTAMLRDVCGVAGPAVEPPPSPASSVADLLSVTAHELRSPMTAILGAAEALERHWDDLPDEARLDLLRMISRQGKRLDALIGDLLVAGRLDAGRLPVQLQDVEVGPVLAAAVEAAGVDPAGIAIDCPPGLRALADPDRLRQVVVNFLVNAHRYGATPIDVQARLRSGDGGPSQIDVTVRDHGDGVRDDAVPHLFQRYSVAADQAGGVGLGLYIARGLAQAMGGDAWYEPAEPGARFGATLPATD